MRALKIPLIIILCLTVLATQVSAAYPPSIYLYDLPATATYTIKTDGTNYWYVRYDGFTGTSTNITSLVWTVCQAMTNGGNIHFEAGTYTINSKWGLVVGSSTYSVPLTFEGEGWTTIFKAATGIGGATAQNATITTRTANSGSNIDYHIIFRNFKVDGNNVGSNIQGIVFCAWQGKIENVWVTDCTSTGIRLKGNGASANAVDNIIERCLINYNDGNGIYVYSNSGDNMIQNNIIHNNGLDGVHYQAGNPMINDNTIYSNDACGIHLSTLWWGTIANCHIEQNEHEEIYVEAGASYATKYISIMGNYIYTHGRTGAATYAMILCDGKTATYSVEGIKIIGNHLKDYFTNSTYAIQLDANTYNCTVVGNDVLGRYSTGIMSDTGTDNIIDDNPGYNPVGYITNPITGSQIRDSGSGAIGNNTLYTCEGSAKTIYITAGTVSSVQVDGQAIFTATGCTVYVMCGQTFKIVWSVPPTIKVFGE